MTFCQELKDFATAATFDDELVDDSVTEDWYRAASAFVQEALTTDKVEETKDKRPQRLGSFDFCCGLDNVHVVMHGRGLIFPRCQVHWT